MKVSANDRNITILKKIAKYCDRINAAKERFGASLEALSNDEIYMNATAMCILQIGELTTHLSVEFRKQYNAMPWQQIKDMRNIAAHHYGEFSAARLWATMETEIDPLRDYCRDSIAKLESEPEFSS
ncbi:MAG: DUF86 domain-containing protein [Clostridiales Family XIII bacterium]|jgi:uncharacterized protein with HEPN domain|nr:DUF86 domain-containing protein [Clostridiales Family XIII bacterium]